MWLTITIIVIGIIVVLLLFYWSFSYRISQKPPIWNAGYLANCVESPCDSPYVCNGNLCVMPEGARCSSANDCITGLCAGVCITSTTGQIGDYCPCKSPGFCVKDLDGVYRCLAGPGASCTIDSNCANNNCVNGFCSNGYPDGYLGCVVNSDCASNSCINGFCSNGVPIGSPGAACGTGCVSYPTAGCTTGLSCDCNSRLCVNTNIGLLNTCSNISLCQPGYVCAENGVCNFPTPPNQPPDGVCQPNFTLNGNVCLANRSYPCSVGSDCDSGGCSAVSALYSCSSTGVLTYLTAGPPGSFIKLLGRSGLFAVTSNGIYSYTSMSWKLLLPGTVDGRTLNDATILSDGSYLGLFGGSYLYIGDESWVCRNQVINADTRQPINNCQYLESSVNDDLLVVANQKVYQLIAGDDRFSGNLSFYQFGSAYSVDSYYYGGRAKYYLNGEMNPTGVSPVTCPANYNNNNIINCPASKNFCFIGNFVGFQRIIYNGSLSGFTQPNNADIRAFAIQQVLNETSNQMSSAVISAITTDGVYLARGATGVIAPGKFSNNSDVAVLNSGEIYLLSTSSCS